MGFITMSPVMSTAYRTFVSMVVHLLEDFGRIELLRFSCEHWFAHFFDLLIEGLSQKSFDVGSTFVVSICTVCDFIESCSSSWDSKGTAWEEKDLLYLRKGLIGLQSLIRINLVQKSILGFKFIIFHNNSIFKQGYFALFISTFTTNTTSSE